MKAQLESLVLEMHRSGMSYEEAVAEFKKCFVENALKETSGHQVNAARQLGMHRNSLSRLITELQVDVRSFRPSSRRPARSESGSSRTKTTASR